MIYVHYTRADGTFGRTGTDGPVAPEVPDDATAISQDEYEQRLADFKASQEERRAAMLDADLQRQRNAYAAMVAVGIPADHARIVSGLLDEDDVPATGTPGTATPPATPPATGGGSLVDVQLPGVGIKLGGR